MTTIYLYGAKGGVGTSTAAVAVALAAYGRTQLVDLHDTDDHRAIVGVGSGDDFYGDPLEFGPGRLGFGPALDVDVTVIDGGTTPPAEAVDVTVLVIEASYLALRRAVNGPRPDHILLVEAPESALGARDVEAALGIRPTVIPRTPKVARSVDAGLFALRTSPYEALANEVLTLEGTPA